LPPDWSSKRYGSEVLKLLAELGEACATYPTGMSAKSQLGAPTAMKSGRSATARTRTFTHEQQEAGAGTVWTWTAIDADTKLILSYVCGDRDARFALEFNGWPEADSMMSDTPALKYKKLTAA
jgi:hypothetical protein